MEKYTARSWARKVEEMTTHTNWTSAVSIAAAHMAFTEESLAERWKNEMVATKQGTAWEKFRDKLINVFDPAPNMTKAVTLLNGMRIEPDETAVMYAIRFWSHWRQ